MIYNQKGKISSFVANLKLYNKSLQANKIEINIIIILQIVILYLSKIKLVSKYFIYNFKETQPIGTQKAHFKRKKH